MRTLDPLRRFFASLVPGGRPPAPVDEKEVELLRQRFRVRHHNFKLLLSGNNEALEQISTLEELARGVRPFGAHALRAHCARILTLAFRAIKHLESLDNTSHPILLERFQALKSQLDTSLAGRRVSHDLSSAPFVLPLNQVEKQSVELTGAKMARLGEARNVLEMRVPEGFVVTTAAFEAFMDSGGLREEIDSRIQARSEALTSRMALAQELQKLIIDAPLPEALERTLIEAGNMLATSLGGPPRLAVRSSAVGEDQSGASFAGQYRSAINISLESLPHVYKEVIASAYSLEAISYRLNKGLSEESATMSVGVLAMVDAVAGGVTYTRDPLGTRTDSVLVYSVFGLPKQMVDGADAADFFALNRENGTVLEHDIGAKTSRTISFKDEGVHREELDPSLGAVSSISPKNARRIYEMAMALERHFGEPQDMEWALDNKGELYLLQARPLPAALNYSTAAHVLDLDISSQQGDEDGQPKFRELGRGLAVSPGVAAGPVHKLRREADMLTMPSGAVMVLKRPLPRFAPALAEAAAIVAEEGGMAGHLASVARELRKPALFGMVNALERLKSGTQVTVDADSRMVLEGTDEVRLQRSPTPGNLMKGSRVHDMLMEILPLVSRLTLLDPQAPEFNSRHCDTLHDIFRYCHEKALLAMFEFGKHNPFPENAAKLRFGGKNSQFKIIDLGGSFQGRKQGNSIRVEDVGSVPFQSFWRGMTAIPWNGPPTVHTKGLVSILHEAMLNTNLEPTMPSAYTTQNYFMVAPDFLSGQSRFGFHFSTVEAMISDRPRENFISFMFKGGAANQQRRENRAVMISALLEALGFETKRTLDMVAARIDNRSSNTMQYCVTALGFITMHTRQLDMVMHSEQAAMTYKDRLLEQLGEFIT